MADVPKAKPVSPNANVRQHYKLATTGKPLKQHNSPTKASVVKPRGRGRG